jgi:hypothetical protein
MNNHELTEVDMLIPSDQRRLKTALDATKPITVDDHQRFRESIAPPKPFDAIDEAAADPIHDHAPRRAAGHKVNRVLGILDELEKENTNRRFTT